MCHIKTESYEGKCRRKRVRRGDDCPVELCSRADDLAMKTNDLGKRITYIGATFVAIMGVIATILIFMSNTSISMAQDATTIARATNEAMLTFIETHNVALNAQTSLIGSLSKGMELQQKQMETTSKIQLELVREVERLKQDETKKYNNTPQPDGR